MSLEAPLTHVFLTGFMGSGKSKLGRILAERTGRRFQDLDRVIEEETQRTIVELFQNDGEPAFRELEAATLRKLADQEYPAIVALGGGAYVSEASREYLRTRGTTVWLDVPRNVLADRLIRKDTRPLLRAPDGSPLSRDAVLGRIDALLEPRRPAYAAADIHFFSIGTEEPEEHARELHGVLQLRGVLP